MTPMAGIYRSLLPRVERDGAPVVVLDVFVDIAHRDGPAEALVLFDDGQLDVVPLTRIRVREQAEHPAMQALFRAIGATALRKSA